MKYIFDEITETKDIYLVINETATNPEDREYLVTVVKDVIHHNVVDLLLDELDDEKRLIFITALDDENEHPTLLGKLGQWISNFEHKVVSKVKETEKELIKLIVSGDI